MTSLLAAILAMGGTLCLYLLARKVHAGCGSPAILHPALTSILATGLLLHAAGIDHDAYFAAAWPLHAALVPITVLLAVPLCRQSGLIFASGGALVLTVAFGFLTSLCVSAALGLGSGTSPGVALTLLTKSVTTAVAVGLAERIGGMPELAPIIVIVTGIVGACAGPVLFRALGVRDDRAMGLAFGMAAHAIGTARAFQRSEIAGTFATLGMILNAILTSTALAIVFFLR